MGRGSAPAAALKRAQAWLRDATRAELVAFVEAAAAKHPEQVVKNAELSISLATRAAGFEVLADRLAHKAVGNTDKRPVQPKARQSRPQLSTAGGTEKPFAHPYFWAGFIHTAL